MEFSLLIPSLLAIFVGIPLAIDGLKHIHKKLKYKRIEDEFGDEVTNWYNILSKYNYNPNEITNLYIDSSRYKNCYEDSSFIKQEVYDNKLKDFSNRIKKLESLKTLAFKLYPVSMDYNSLMKKIYVRMMNTTKPDFWEEEYNVWDEFRHYHCYYKPKNFNTWQIERDKEVKKVNEEIRIKKEKSLLYSRPNRLKPKQLYANGYYGRNYNPDYDNTIYSTSEPNFKRHQPNYFNVDGGKDKWGFNKSDQIKNTKFNRFRYSGKYWY